MSNRCYGDKYKMDNAYKLFGGVSYATAASPRRISPDLRNCIGSDGLEIPIEPIYTMLIAKINALTIQYNALVDELVLIKTKAPFVAVSLPIPDEDIVEKQCFSVMLLVNKYNKLVAKYNRLVDEVFQAQKTMDLLLTTKRDMDGIAPPTSAETAAIQPDKPVAVEITEPVYITEETYIIQETYFVEETYVRV